MPLDFLKFVTNIPVLDFVPLGGFHKSWLQAACDIKYFHRTMHHRMYDIKFEAFKHAISTVKRRKAWTEIKSYLQILQVLRQKTKIYSNNTDGKRLHLMSSPRPEKKLWKSIMAYSGERCILWKQEIVWLDMPELVHQSYIKKYVMRPCFRLVMVHWK